MAKYGGGDVADLPAAAPRLRATARGETGEPAIRVDGLRVNRGGREILHAVSLTAATGAITGLLGPSGCGKSTLMRAIVGVQIVAGGTVKALGEPAGSPSLRRRVAYVTQAPSVYGDLTVRENIEYFARVLGAREQIDGAIDAVGLAPHAGDSRAPALGRPTGPRVPRDGAARPAGAPRARRADRRPRPPASP